MEKSNQSQKKNVGNNLPTISAINEGGINNLIYEIRGHEVMLDSDLAKIYGYETRSLNRQVKNNIEKFEGEDFMFQLTRDELDEISRCKKCTLNNKRGSNVKYCPHAFTEQGIYMLMTVLKGDLATKQSRALIMAFKSMKSYILENRILQSQKDQLNDIIAVLDSHKQIAKVENAVANMDTRLTKLEKEMNNAVMKTEISPIILDFSKSAELQEYLLMNGELLKAKDTYQTIYSKARHNIYIIDDYIDIRTLQLLTKVNKTLSIVIFSDNVNYYLHQNDYDIFKRETNLEIQFIKTCGFIHDRFITIDYDTKSETVYHCGASSKDAGKTLTAITEFHDDLVIKSMHKVIETMLQNPELRLN